MSTKKEKTAIRLLGFVPALVVQYLADKQEIKELPAKQQFKSVVMFADISGFTNLTETLQKIGPEGAELTAFAINRYMELLVKTVSKSGGDIFKFAGDAMIVVWPPSTKTDQVEQHLELRSICKMAIQSAMEIQARLDNTAILENIRLSVKIGFGFGDINIIYVGGVFGRSEYLATGDPLKQAFQSEHYATAGGQTIVSQEVFTLVEGYFNFAPVKHHQEDLKNSLQPPSQFYFVERRVGQLKIRLKAEALLIKNSINISQFERIKSQIMMYIPAALLPYIDSNLEQWSSELRRVTTLFINLGIDLADAKTDNGLQRIQNVIKTVQKCVYMYEGSLNKLLMDDKGSTLIIVFGLPPISHQNDAVRAILTAFLLEEQLRRIKCRCGIGISTGTAFCGIIGTSGSRREYSILGDCVNLSARLMQMTINPMTPSILVDEQTAMDAEQKVHSIFWGERKVKGKDKLIQVYEPLIPQDSFRKINELRTHYQQHVQQNQESNETNIEGLEVQGKVKLENSSISNSIMNMGRRAVKTISNGFKTRQQSSISGLGKSYTSGEYQWSGVEHNLKSQQSTKSLKSLGTLEYELTRVKRKTLSNPNQLMVGMDQEITQINQSLQDFINFYEQQGKVQNQIVFIKGIYGIGKSFFIKNILNKISVNNKQVYKYNDFLEIMISCLNPITKTCQLNSIRIILRNIFLSIAQRLEKQPNQNLVEFILKEKLNQQESVMQGFDQQSYDFLQKMLGINQTGDIEFPGPDQKQIQEIILASKSKLKFFVLRLFSLYLDQKPNKSNLASELNLKEEEESKQPFQKFDLKQLNAPLILVFDDMQDCDEISFFLIKTILKYFSNIYVIGIITNFIFFQGLVRTNYIELYAFKPEKEKIQVETWQKGLLLLQQTVFNCQVINLKGLKQNFNVEGLQELIRKYYDFNRFQLEVTQKSESFENITRQLDMTDSVRLKNKTTIRQPVHFESSLSSKIKDPLLFFESKKDLEKHDFSTLVYNYIYLKTKGHPLVAINLLNNLINQNFLKIDASRVGMISARGKAVLQHEEWIRLDVPLTFTQITGPIIDRLFCVHQLVMKMASVIGEIFDLQTLYRVLPFKDVINQKTLLGIIKDLERKDVIEYMSGTQENEHYRFNYPFIREVLYQRMTFSQRRQLHKNVAEAFQIIPRPFDYNERKEYKQLELHWFLASQKPSVTIQKYQNPHEKINKQEKQLIVVKKIKQQLDRSLKERKIQLKSSYLLKRSEKGVFWDYRFCSLDSENFKIFSLDDNDELSGDSVIILPLIKIQEVTSLYSSETGQHGMAVGVSGWHKRNLIIDNYRKFQFNLEHEDEMIEWTTYLEFARTYSVYSDFVFNFGPISFPITFSDYDQELCTELHQDMRKGSRIGRDEEVTHKGNLSQRMSRQSRLTRIKNRTNTRKQSAAFELFANLSGSQFSNQETLINDTKTVKDRVKIFLMKSLLVLNCHLICGLEQNIESQESHQVALGDNNIFMERYPEFFQINTLPQQIKY